MKDLVEYIVRSITSKPDEVKITESEEDESGRVILTLEVSEEDKGRVIGKQGRVIQSIRTLLRVTAVKQDVRVTLEII